MGAMEKGRSQTEKEIMMEIAEIKMEIAEIREDYKRENAEIKEVLNKILVRILIF